MRALRSYILLFFKGMAMGAADVVPGVSGGTIAFISGIYVELLDSIRAVNLYALRLLFTQGPVQFWRNINGTFLLVLFAGILCSIFSLARIVSFSLEEHPLLVWSFFFGLIVASIVYVWRQQTHWRWPQWLALGAGTLLAVAASLSPPLQIGATQPAVFFAGMLAICAMILPGISGSFILLLLGLYPTIIDAVNRLDLAVLLVFAVGAGIGLLSFSRVLSWLLHHQRSTTLSLLTGILLGSLLVVWPWKQPVETLADSHGNLVVVTRELMAPGQYASVVGDPQVIACILLMLLGLVLVLGLEYLGGRRNTI